MDLGDLSALFAARRRLDLAILDAVSALDWSDSGYGRLWQLLRDTFRIPAAEAKRLVAQIDLLCPQVAVTGQPIPEKLPAARAAMADGVISPEHVAQIAAVVHEVPASHTDQVDVEMTELAREFAPAELGRLGQRIVAALNPDGDQPEDRVLSGSRNQLDLQHRRDGSVAGRFVLDAETAGHLLPLLSPLTTPQPGDDRVLAERQGDALADVIRMAADAGTAPMEGGERPHVAVTVSLETLRTGLGHATLDDGHPVTAEQARLLACDARIIPMVLGSKSQPIDIGEHKRLADKRLRRALAIRDKGCAVGGCGRTPNQCHAHHVQHWVDGGPTTLANTVLLCHYHHRLIHHAGWHVRMDQGLPVITRPAWMQAA